MTRSQFRFVMAVSACVAAVGLWLWSYFVFPSRGYVRTLFLLAAVLALLYPFQGEYQAASREHPIEAIVFGVIVAVWLFALLGAVLFAQSRGFEIPTARGPNRPIAFMVAIAPCLYPVAWRLRHVYSRLGRASA